MGAQENKAVVAGAIELWNAHDERYFDVYADDAPMHGLPGETPPNKEGFKGMIQAMWKAFPDIRIEVMRETAEGETHAMHLKATGTHEDEFMGAPPTGNPVEFDLMSFARFDERGKIVERWHRIDEFALLGQLGLLPAPAPTSA